MNVNVSSSSILSFSTNVKPTKILFLGSPSFSLPSLKALACNDNFQIVGVITQPDRPAGRNLKHKQSPVKDAALQMNLNVFSPDKINTNDSIEFINSLGAEAAVVVAYGQILSTKFLNLFSQGVFNIHASLLPRWRGAAPIQRAIMAGDEESGVCLQKLVLKLDAGDVLGFRTIKITSDMNALSLHDRLAHLGKELLDIDFVDYLKGSVMPKPQQESLATYAKKIEKHEGLIQWQHMAVDIFNHIRGLILNAGAWTIWNGRKLKIFKSSLINVDINHLAKNQKFGAGSIIQINKDSLLVACGQGVLSILEVQMESRCRQTISEFILGYQLKVGDRFE